MYIVDKLKDMEAISRYQNISLIKFWEEKVRRMREGLPEKKNKKIRETIIQVLHFSLLVHSKNNLHVNIFCIVWRNQIIISLIFNGLIKYTNEHNGKANIELNFSLFISLQLTLFSMELKYERVHSTWPTVFFQI